MLIRIGVVLIVCGFVAVAVNPWLGAAMVPFGVLRMIR